MDRAKGRTAAAAGFCLALVLILLMIAATIYYISGNGPLLGAEMRRYSDPAFSGLPDEQYPEMGRMISEYLTGRLASFQFFLHDDERNTVPAFHSYEADHMADCRQLIQWAGRLSWLLGGAALILIGAGIIMRGERKKFTSGVLAGLGFSVLSFMLVLGWGMISFDSLFIVFHRLFFTNDGWLLNPQTDMLIRLMPTSFFVSMGTKVLLGAAVMMTACLTAAVLIRRTGNKDEKGTADER